MNTRETPRTLVSRPRLLRRISILGKMLPVLTAVGAICTADNLQAGQIQGVTISDVSSQQFAYPSTATYSVTNLVTSAGLFGDRHAFVPQGCMWLSATGPNSTNYVTFNLGKLYTVNGMKVWNYNDSSFISGANGRIQYGVSNAAISYSTDGVNFTTNVASQNFNEGYGNFNPYAQSITFPSAVVAQYIRFNIKTNWGGGATGVGLAKVRFLSNTNPPAVLSASENYGSNQVTVIFSETVDVSSATNLANYSINSSGATTISGVTIGEYGDRVILSTSPLTNNGYSVSVSGVYDSTVTAAVNSTVPVQSELYLWLRADQGVTTTSAFGGDMVTAWNDQSPYGHNAQTANFFGVLTNGPFLATGVNNGLPALQFFGTNVLEIPNDAANPINGDMTLLMVVSTSGSSFNQDVICKTGGGSSATVTNNLSAPFDFYFTTAIKPTFLWGNNGVNANNIGANQGETAGSFYVVALSVTATNFGQIIINGSSPLYDLSQNPNNRLSAYQQFGGAPQDAGNPIAIGARNSGGATLGNAQPLVGYLSEAMLIRGTITSNDLVNAGNYLAAKYGIAPVNITEEPASLTANAGSQATFWVGASGMQPFSYQWYSNNVPIAGATGMSYTTPYVTASANNASYTVTVTNASGTSSSTAAILTVVSPTTPPTVFSAAKTTGLTNGLVVFSEAVDSVTSLNPANYSIDGGISVVSAAAGSAANQVVLTTSLLNPNGLYHLSVNHVQDQYGNAMAAVIVPLMPAGLTMWLRGDSGVVTNGSTDVDAWLDQTANGNNAQTYGIGAAYRPSIGIDSAANGSPVLFFNASSPNFLVAPGSPTLNMTGDMTVYEVFNVTDYSGYRDIISKADATTRANSYDLYLNTGTGQVKWNRGDGTAYHTGTLTGPAIAAGKPVAYCMTHQGSGIQPGQGGTGFNYVNGLATGSTAFLTATMADFNSPVTIGVRGSFDLAMNGDIAEVMVFSNALSGADRTNIDNYLGAKYFTMTNSLPLTNQSALVGTRATFSVSPSQGSAHLAYQWVENSTNIPGANGLTYTTGTLMASDNGDTFSVLVIAGSVTNKIGPVTLTVTAVPPMVQTYGAAIWGTNTLIVTFQEPLNPSIAANVANYSLDHGATVLSASLVSPIEVLLTTSLLDPGTTYTLTVQNLQDMFGSIMTTTNLVNVASIMYPPNVALWLRADAGISAASGEMVAEWDDQSGNGNNFVNGGFLGPATYPAFVTNAVNGWPAVQFNATNLTYMHAPSSPSLAITSDMGIFAVMNFTTFANSNGVFGPEGGADIISKNNPNGPSPYGYPNSYDYYVYYNTQTPYFLRGDGTAGVGTFAGAGNAPSTGIWHELSATMLGGNIYHRLDGHQNGTVSWSGTGAQIADGGGDALIGTRGDNGVSLTGEMAELIVIGSTLSTNDTGAIETYLGAKYGLIATSEVLNISATNGTALLSWPNPQWSFVLQSAPSLTSPIGWSTVTNAPNVINNLATVTVPLGTSQMFYRLRSQSQ